MLNTDCIAVCKVEHNVTLPACHGAVEPHHMVWSYTIGISLQCAATECAVLASGCYRPPNSLTHALGTTPRACVPAVHAAKPCTPELLCCDLPNTPPSAPAQPTLPPMAGASGGSEPSLPHHMAGTGVQGAGLVQECHGPASTRHTIRHYQYIISSIQHNHKGVDPDTGTHSQAMWEALTPDSQPAAMGRCITSHHQPHP
jgi:hypothetical protein